MNELKKHIRVYVHRADEIGESNDMIRMYVSTFVPESYRCMSIINGLISEARSIK